MFLEAILIGLIMGIFRNGRITNIAMIHFRGFAFIIIGILLQILPIFLGRSGLLSEYYNLMTFVGMMSIFIALLRNLEVRGIWIIALGALINIIVVAINGFSMPAFLNAYTLAGLSSLAETIKDGSVINMVDAGTIDNVSKYLGKGIPIPRPYPLPKVISVGDVIMTVGIAWFVFAELTGKRYLSNTNRMVRYSYKR